MSERERSHSSPLHLGASTLILIAGLLAATHAGASQLFVSGFSPPFAPEGAPVTVDGGGFGTAPENLRVFVWNAQTTEGAPLAVITAQPSQLGCEVGLGAQPMLGELVVVKGLHHLLPTPPLLPLDGGTVVIEEVSWFIGVSVATAPGLFEVVEGSDRPPISNLIAGHIRLSLSEIMAPVGPGPEWRLTADSFPCDGGGGGGGPPPGGESTSCSMVQGQVTFSYLSAKSASEGQPNLAADLAAIFNASFSNLGYTATADGSDLVISREGGISQGFASLSVCTANC